MEAQFISIYFQICLRHSGRSPREKGESSAGMKEAEKPAKGRWSLELASV